MNKARAVAETKCTEHLKKSTQDIKNAQIATPNLMKSFPYFLLIRRRIGSGCLRLGTLWHVNGTLGLGPRVFGLLCSICKLEICKLEFKARTVAQKKCARDLKKNSAVCVRTRTVNVNTFSTTVKDEISEGR